MASHSDIDIAVMDLGLPDIDGHHVAQSLRLMAPSMRLIALTGFVAEERRRLAESAGFDAFLAKPIRLEGLESAFEPDAAAAPDSLHT